MLSQCQPLAPKHKFRFKLDATVIDLCLYLYDWAKFRTTKGAIKLHVKLNHAGYLPTFMVTTEGKVHESTIAPSALLKTPCCPNYGSPSLVSAFGLFEI